MSDYLNPLKNSLVNNYEILSITVKKSKYKTFKEIKVINDNGWIFNSKDTSSVYSHQSITNDFNLKDAMKEDVIYTYYMYFGKNYDEFTRNYSKIQEVFAQIGGFCNFFYFLLFNIFKALSCTYQTLKINEKFLFSDDRKCDLKVSKMTNSKHSRSINIKNIIDISAVPEKQIIEPNMSNFFH